MDKLRIENAVRELLIAIGENPDREGILETPARVANMYTEIFAGMYRDPMEDVKIFHEELGTEPVIVKDIAFYSMCEHHLLPFYGKAHVAYLPNNGQILGLSKLARIVDTAAKKLQLQERLGKEVADFIFKSCDAKGVMVIIEAEHLCMTMRGIKKPGSRTVTIASNGIFEKDSQRKQQAFDLLRWQ